MTSLTCSCFKLSPQQPRLTSRLTCKDAFTATFSSPWSSVLKCKFQFAFMQTSSSLQTNVLKCKVEFSTLRKRCLLRQILSKDGPTRQRKDNVCSDYFIKNCFKTCKNTKLLKISSYYNLLRCVFLVLDLSSWILS